MKLSQAQEEILPERSMDMSQTERTTRRFICTMMNESLHLLLHTYIKSLPSQFSRTCVVSYPESYVIGYTTQHEGTGLSNAENFRSPLIGRVRTE